jgi:hypothetical protein
MSGRLQQRVRNQLKTLLVSLVWTIGPSTPGRGLDLSGQVELLGEPFASKPIYARNIWDLQSFGGRLYLGHGNSSNQLPSPNAGPVPIVFWDPVSASFVTAYTVNDEQIDRYRVLDGQLYVPGHDPRDDSSLGNYYVLGRNGWSKYRNVPGGVHMLDLCRYDGALFAALGSMGSTIWASTNGANWRSALEPSLAVSGRTGGRVYSFFRFGETLHALTLVRLPNFEYQPTVLRYDRNQQWFVAEASTTVSNLFPQTALPFGRDYRLERAVSLGDKLFYVLGRAYNDLQWESLGLFWATNVNSGVRVRLPAASQVWDLAEHGGRVWALLSEPKPESTNVWVSVTSTVDGHQWQELLRFESPTLARSFEWLAGDLYFGLGCSTNQLEAATGQLRRIRKEWFSPRLAIRRIQAGLELALIGPSEQSFVIDGSSDSAEWTPLATNAAPARTMQWIDAETRGTAGYFYRARLTH